MNAIDLLKRTCPLLLVLPLSVAAAAGAAMPAKEMQTAMQHAGFAMQQDGLAGVHLHLHHTINCLVGPHGQGFDADAGNPCDGMGNGAINDAANAQVKPMLQQALSLARTAESIDSLEPAKDVAMAVHALLSDATNAK
jgi:hypothetical protein